MQKCFLWHQQLGEKKGQNDSRKILANTVHDGSGKGKKGERNKKWITSCKSGVSGISWVKLIGIKKKGKGRMGWKEKIDKEKEKKWIKFCRIGVSGTGWVKRNRRALLLRLHGVSCQALRRWVLIDKFALEAKLQFTGTDN